MDRLSSRMPTDDGPDAEPVALPSRAAALDACRAGLARGGPILLTGAAGAGKTWVARRLTSADPRAWARVEAAPGQSPGDFLRSVATGLGLTAEGSDGSIRHAVAEALDLAGADGRALGLMIDEAHLASDDVLEEVRLLSNRLPAPLTALVLIGQTPLARRIDRSALRGLESRLAARVHLLPLDADEASTLLATRGGPSATDTRRVDRWHRDAEGNPRRLIRLAEHAAAIAPAPSAVATATLPSAVESRPAAAIPPPAPRASEPLVPAKPPILVEDGLIEVGWDSASESEAPGSRFLFDDPGDPQPIDDHYAALQAWDEWAKNQGRGATRPARPPDDLDEIEPDDEDGSPLDSASGLWGERAQGFGPYSQLFSRLKPVREAD